MLSRIRDMVSAPQRLAPINIIDQAVVSNLENSKNKIGFFNNIVELIMLSCISNFSFKVFVLHMVLSD